MVDRSAAVRRWWFAGLVASCGIIGAPRAQEKPPGAAEPEESEVLAAGARELGAYAALALKNGFPSRARQAWLEVLAEYGSDDEDARKALGFYRHGAVWQRDAKFVFPDRDQLDAAVARMLEQRWQAVAGRLAGLHRTAAEKLAAAGKRERAEHHARRALRFLPTDAKAMAAAGVRQFEGISGDEVDIAVLQRSRLMDRAVAQLTEQKMAVAPVDTKLPLLDAIGVPYRAVQSDHFTVYGDLDVALLQDAAVWAERALAFCQQAYAGHEGFPPKGQPSSRFVFLAERDVWTQLVKKHGGRNAEFIVANASATEFDGIETAVAREPELVRDLAVRWVAQDFSGLTADALEEGIGHAVVGMFFGKNLVFSVGQVDPQGTVAGGREQKKLLLPDLDTWKELAIDLAWQRGGTPAAKLPLLKSAEFPSDARIKAWSFCDYLLRRDPKLLRQLQQTAAKAKSENDVLGAFQELAGQPLQHVEDRWRRFWTEDSPLRRAVLTRVTPLEAASREAPEWLALFNRLRVQCGAKEVGWSAAQSTVCREHVDYLKQNKDQRGPEKEHGQLAGRPGHGNAARAFAAGALVWTRDKKKAEEQWLLLPGYRDAIVNPNLELVGIYADGGIVVIDVGRGTAGGAMVTTQVWPAGSDGGRAPAPVPAALDVELFGPELQQLLAANQRGKQKQVGYPLTFHGYAANDMQVRVTVTCQGEEVKGFFGPARGAYRWSSAPGLWVFWPAEPWRRGVDITAHWQWKGGEHRVTFLAN